MITIISDPRVREYELTYLVPAALTSAEITKTRQAVDALLKKHGIKVSSQEDWGRKELAYPIKYQGKKQTEALYVHAKLEVDASVIQAFEQDLYLQAEVIRHLLVLAQPETSNMEDLRPEKGEKAKRFVRPEEDKE